MSSFTTELIASPTPNGRHWRLAKTFTYHIGTQFSRHYIRIPKGFLTDFASVPRIFWWLPDWATYSKAPVLHDWLYQHKMINWSNKAMIQISRREADDLFLEAMMVDWAGHKSRYLVARMEYLAVRLFGWLAWH